MMVERLRDNATVDLSYTSKSGLNLDVQNPIVPFSHAPP